LIDRGSTNGTYVNGARIAEHPLQRGDLIRIGKSTFAFQIGPAVAPVQAVPVEPVSLPARVPPGADGSRGLGAYQLAETIGVGGAATVYKAYTRANHTPVAIKILHSRDPFVRQKFQSEGIIGEQLSHPHIVKVLDHGEDNGYYFIAMEYIDGGSLRQRLAPGKPAALDFVQVVIGQTCDALAYAHQRGVVHRDIKPENIMLATQDGVKVVDFGIAQIATVTTQTVEGKLVGTPYYIPYEIVEGEKATPASDIYSLGIVLYEMLTGQWPFTGKTSEEVLHKHRTQNPIPPRRLNPALPPEMELIALRALQKNISQRYQNALDLARDLGYRPGMSFQVAPISNLTTMPPSQLSQPRIPSPAPVPSPGQSGKPRLIVITGAMRGKEIPCGQGQTIFGREAIDLQDVSISRGSHFCIVQVGNQFWIEDAGSTNGTFVNDKRIRTRLSLRPGDKIRVGQTRLNFVV
jgi:serine/threonine protein kinase